MPQSASDRSTIRRAPHDAANPYVMIRRASTADTRLSWRARGLLAYLLSLPSDWTLRVSTLISQGPEGKAAVYAGLKELKTYGYLEEVIHRHPTRGFITGREYLVHEVPLEPPEAPDELDSDNRDQVDSAGCSPLPPLDSGLLDQAPLDQAKPPLPSNDPTKELGSQMATDDHRPAPASIDAPPEGDAASGALSGECTGEGALGRDEDRPPQDRRPPSSSGPAWVPQTFWSEDETQRPQKARGVPTPARALMDRHAALFEQQVGSPYLPHWGRDMARLKAALALYDQSTLERLQDQFFAQGADSFPARAGFTAAEFVREVPALLVAAAQQASAPDIRDAVLPDLAAADGAAGAPAVPRGTHSLADVITGLPEVQRLTEGRHH